MPLKSKPISPFPVHERGEETAAATISTRCRQKTRAKRGRMLDKTGDSRYNKVSRITRIRRGN